MQKITEQNASFIIPCIVLEIKSYADDCWRKPIWYFSIIAAACMHGQVFPNIENT